MPRERVTLCRRSRACNRTQVGRLFSTERQPLWLTVLVRQSTAAGGTGRARAPHPDRRARSPGRLPGGRRRHRRSRRPGVARAGTVASGRTAVAWAQEAEQRGAGEILLTSIDADGTRAGYDLELTSAVAGHRLAPVIASGGAGEARHVAEAPDVAQAALLASIVHENPDERLLTSR